MHRHAVTRLPAVADRFYPADPDALSADVDRYLAHARVPPLHNVQAVLAPHAGYICSGLVAGHSFQVLRGESTEEVRVYLLGPAHWGGVETVALSRASLFRTPLGDVPVDGEEVERLLSIGPPFAVSDDAHAPEHCLEVELPFLQRVLSRFRIVPLLFGSAPPIETIAAELDRRLDATPHPLIVVSTDLSHYLPEPEARRRDRFLLQRILEDDCRQAAGCEACGMKGLLVLMHIARKRRWKPHLLAYGTSADTCGPRTQVVGYASVAYTA